MPAKVATPLQSVDLLDCAVEHLSWLERRIGLRDARGVAKRTWDGELLAMLGKRAKRLERRASSHRVKGPRRLKTIAVLPFFATSPECEDPKAACTTGSSAPAMRRHFLNTTYWSIVDALTPHVVLSVCSHTDAEFARRHSGLQWFDVLESECFIPRRITGVPFFKPALLGAKTVHAIRDKLQNEWSNIEYVYYSEADQVLHTRNARFMLSVVDEATYVSPHRMQPIAHPSDMPSLATPEGRDWLPRWSQQDLDRMARIGSVVDVDRAKNWRCSAVWKSTSVSGAPDNSSLSHFSATTRPSWLGRAARNRHRHAIEQAPRRWRGGRRDDSARTRRKILISTQVLCGKVRVHRRWVTRR
jgi:hypothetical protein